MKPTEILAEASTEDGRPVTLAREAGFYVVRVAGAPLISSRVHGSEEEMARHALPDAPDDGADADADAGRAPARALRVLVGGLGMGFTLRAVLDRAPADASLIVTELLPALVEWNRGVLGPLADHPLDDSRVELVVADVVEYVRGTRGRSLDAILLDIDNGPEALTVKGNRWLYGPAGLRVLRGLLRPGGRLVVWSAFASPAFEARLTEVGFDASVVRVRARGGTRRGPRHLLYVGVRPSTSR